MKLLIAVLSLSLVACQSEAEKHDSLMIDQCIMKLKGVVKDPYSIKFTVKPTIIEVSDKLGNKHREVEIMYNAKNSFGAYAGEDVFYCK